ncbi:hypothetical protein ADEAN_000746100 [Angomonas deanei]|uniref:Uncharacterized protein n=1 Tax=Angomonas deanei TaxID=59799 RepID=A0A7G2CLK5_9TRYP|nr:hypothetical protein ADEAN_000746100 [Angomonas deanei]
MQPVNRMNTGLMSISITMVILLSIIVGVLWIEFWLIDSDTDELFKSWGSYRYTINGETDYLGEITNHSREVSLEHNTRFLETMWKVKTQRLNTYGSDRGSPVAAVVVEPEEFTANALPYLYKQILIDAYRAALLSGSPYVILAGNTVQCAAALNFLNQLPSPAATLFPEGYVLSLPPLLRQVALSLNESLSTYDLLYSWSWQQPAIDSLKPIHFTTADESVLGGALDYTIEVLTTDLVADVYADHGVSDVDKTHGDRLFTNTYKLQSATPRVVTVATGLRFVVPGIVLAENNNIERQTQQKASEMLFSLLLSVQYNQRSSAAAHHHASNSSSLWMRHGYSVMTVASSSEQKRTKLLYSTALRNAHNRVTEQMKAKMFNSVVRQYYLYNSKNKSISSALREVVRREVNDMDIKKMVRLHDQIVVLRPSGHLHFTGSDDSVDLQPSTSSLPPGSNTDCNFVFRFFGRYAHYIYQRFLLFRNDFKGTPTELTLFQIFEDIDSKRVSISEVFLSFFR